MPTRPDVLLATCAEFPDGDVDDALLRAALADRGIDARWAVWDDPDVRWEEAGLVLLRSTWDYSRRYDAFVAWADRIPRLRNPASVVRWNTDKRYLADLDAAGVPTVPTRFLAPGEGGDVPAGEIVVKPVVSAGSRDTARHPAGAAAAARDHVERLHAAGRTAMVQPYVDRTDDLGETALVFLGGEFSHAIRKGPLLRPGEAPVRALFAPEEITPRASSLAERDVAAAALAAVPGDPADLFYARVDLLAGDDGPCVLEVELTEPSLFFGHAPGAAARLADLVAAAR